jgi:hypothetical protein
VLLDACHAVGEFLVLANHRFAVERVLNALDFHFETVDAVVKSVVEIGDLFLRGREALFQKTLNLVEARVDFSI